MDNKLNELVMYASEHVTYYRELFKRLNIDPSKIDSAEALVKLPLLTKDMIQNDPDSFVADEYQKYPKCNGIIIKRTSGSTGKYLKILWDYKDEIKSLMPLWIVRNRIYGLSPAMRWCNFYSVNYGGNKVASMTEKKYSENGRYLGFSKLDLTYEKIIKVYKEMIEFQPEWLMMQPSLAYLMAEVVRKEKLPVSEKLRVIELSGEYLFDNFRKAIEETFNVRVVNMYGCNESNEIAMEFNDGKMHVLKDNVVVEVIKDGSPVIDEEGDIYVTSLNNHAMPFIRYETGDKGTLHINNDGDQILEIKTGRSSDFISLENGEKLNSYVLLSIMEYANENMSSLVKQFQFIQTDFDKFTIKAVIDESRSGWKKAFEEEFVNNINDRLLKNAEWNFEWTNAICPDAKTGKFKFFINEIKDIA